MCETTVSTTVAGKDVMGPGRSVVAMIVVMMVTTRGLMNWMRVVELSVVEEITVVVVA